MRAISSRGFCSAALSALVVWCAGSGCKSVSERRLLDTEGREFLAKCQRSGECTLSQTSGQPAEAGKTAFALTRTGRLVGICDVAPGGVPDTPAECRPLVCQADSDCPPSHGLKDGQCVNALCTDPAQALVTPDSVMLCLAGSGIGHDQPRQVDRYALGLNCGAPCKVPAPCRQP
jgi:hypothetical protein